MIVLCFPLIITLEWVNRLVGYQRGQDRISRTEVAATIRLGWEGGSLGAREYHIVSNLLALSRVRVADILTPRTVVFSLPSSMTVREAMEAHNPIRYARVPIYADSADHLTGYVSRFDLSRAAAEGEGDRTLASLARPLPALPSLATVADALDRFLREGEHIAMAVDEYGGVKGILTLEDALESLVGMEIVDETDAAHDMRELARRRARQARQRHRGLP
jgi:CBS domain containing-hemolysin-like protein